MLAEPELHHANGHVIASPEIGCSEVEERLVVVSKHVIQQPAVGQERARRIEVPVCWRFCGGVVGLLLDNMHLAPRRCTCCLVNLVKPVKGRSYLWDTDWIRLEQAKMHSMVAQETDLFYEFAQIITHSESCLLNVLDSKECVVAPKVVVQHRADVLPYDSSQVVVE